jgi:hypothetical protein
LSPASVVVGAEVVCVRAVVVGRVVVAVVVVGVVVVVPVVVGARPASGGASVDAGSRRTDGSAMVSRVIRCVAVPSDAAMSSPSRTIPMSLIG